KRAVERAGVLEYLPLDPGSAPIVGLRRFRDWLEKRRVAFTEPVRAKQLGLPSPRGVLLTGVQGCGKSLSAKALSASFRLPLLRLDPGTLFRKYVGESEQNLRRALATAEQVAPCILWIDEIEKVFANPGDSDGGTGRRMFGSFLTWLQEKDASVFVFATANDISGLPPELLRKGRFDEIFFVDLPNAELREHVFALHLARREQPPDAFDLAALAEATEGFSGAEIEQVVVAGAYSAFARASGLTSEILLDEARLTRPLSVTMAEKIGALRAWARGRAIPADDE
ncbi:MAG TPA: AAA family ATPase, partial [Polyangiaceae bacterium]|nr:AAA family ATPase [Polyangiaceae bacterium]